MKKHFLCFFIILLIFLPACTQAPEEPSFPFLPEQIIQQDFYAYYVAYANKLTPSEEMQLTFTLDTFEVTSETLHLERNNYRPVANFAVTRYDSFGNAFGRAEGEVLIHYYLQDGTWVVGILKFQPKVDLFYLEGDTLTLLSQSVFLSDDERGGTQARIINLTEEGVITVAYTDNEGETLYITATFHKFISVDTVLDQTHYFQFRNNEVSVWLGNSAEEENGWTLEIDSEGVLKNF